MIRIRKTIAVIAASVYCVTNVFCGPSYGAAANLPGVQYNLEPAVIDNSRMIPENLGRISSSAYFGGKDVVVVIYDLHCNGPVQKSIYNIIEHLDKSSHLKSVLIEGAPRGRVSTAFLSGLPEENIRKLTINDLLEKGYLGAGEAYCALNRKDILYGLEDWPVYQQNLASARTILGQSTALSTVAEIRGKLAGLKKMFCSSLWVRVERSLSPSRKPRHYRNIEKWCGYFKISLEKYPNLSLAVVDEHRGLSSGEYQKVNIEFSECIRLLKNCVPYEQWNGLQKKYSGQDNIQEYVRGAFKLAEKYCPDQMIRFKNLNAYVSKIENRRRINEMALAIEEKQCIKEIRSRASRTLLEKELLFVEEMLDYIGDFVNLKVSKEDIREFEKDSKKFRLVLSKYFGWKQSLDLLKIAENNVYSDFLEGNLRRDGIFYESLLKTFTLEPARPAEKDPANRNTDFPDLKESNVRVVVIGGFHNGIEDYLNKGRISHVCVIPKAQGESDGSLYRMIMAQETTSNRAENQSILPEGPDVVCGNPESAQSKLGELYEKETFTTWIEKAISRGLTREKILEDIYGLGREYNCENLLSTNGDELIFGDKRFALPPVELKNDSRENIIKQMKTAAKYAFFIAAISLAIYFIPGIHLVIPYINVSIDVFRTVASLASVKRGFENFIGTSLASNGLPQNISAQPVNQTQSLNIVSSILWVSGIALIALLSACVIWTLVQRRKAKFLEKHPVDEYNISLYPGLKQAAGKLLDADDNNLPDKFIFLVDENQEQDLVNYFSNAKGNKLVDAVQLSDMNIVINDAKNKDLKVLETLGKTFLSNYQLAGNIGRKTAIINLCGYDDEYIFSPLGAGIEMSPFEMAVRNAVVSCSAVDSNADKDSCIVSVFEPSPFLGKITCKPGITLVCSNDSIGRIISNKKAEVYMPDGENIKDIFLPTYDPPFRRNANRSARNRNVFTGDFILNFNSKDQLRQFSILSKLLSQTIMSKNNGIPANGAGQANSAFDLLEYLLIPMHKVKRGMRGMSSYFAKLCSMDINTNQRNCKMMQGFFKSFEHTCQVNASAPAKSIFILSKTKTAFEKMDRVENSDYALLRSAFGMQGGEILAFEKRIRDIDSADDEIRRAKRALYSLNILAHTHNSAYQNEARCDKLVHLCEEIIDVTRLSRHVVMDNCIPVKEIYLILNDLLAKFDGIDKDYEDRIEVIKAYVIEYNDMFKQIDILERMSSYVYPKSWAEKIMKVLRGPYGMLTGIKHSESNIISNVERIVSLGNMIDINKGLYPDGDVNVINRYSGEQENVRLSGYKQVRLAMEEVFRRFEKKDHRLFMGVLPSWGRRKVWQRLTALLLPTILSILVPLISATPINWISLLLGPGLSVGAHWMFIGLSFWTAGRKSELKAIKMSGNVKGNIEHAYQLADEEESAYENSSLRDFVLASNIPQRNVYQFAENLLKEWELLVGLPRISRREADRIRGIAQELIIMTKLDFEVAPANTEKYADIYESMRKLSVETVSRFQEILNKNIETDVTVMDISKMIDIEEYATIYNHSLDFITSMEVFSAYKPPARSSFAYIPALIIDTFYGINNGFDNASEGLAGKANKGRGGLLKELSEQGNNITEKLYDYRSVKFNFDNYRQSLLYGVEHTGINFWWKIRRVTTRFLPMIVIIYPFVMLLLSMTTVPGFILSLLTGVVLSIAFNWIPQLSIFYQNRDFNNKIRAITMARNSLHIQRSAIDESKKVILKDTFERIVKKLHADDVVFPDKLVILCGQISPDETGLISNAIREEFPKLREIEFRQAENEERGIGRLFTSLKVMYEADTLNENSILLFLDLGELAPDAACRDSIDLVSAGISNRSISPLILALFEGLIISLKAREKGVGGIINMDVSRPCLENYEIYGDITLFGTRSSWNEILQRKSGCIFSDSNLSPFLALSPKIRDPLEQMQKEHVNRFVDTSNLNVKQFNEPTANVAITFNDMVIDGETTVSAHERFESFMEKIKEAGRYAENNCSNISMNIFEHFIIPWTRRVQPEQDQKDLGTYLSYLENNANSRDKILGFLNKCENVFNTGMRLRVYVPPEAELFEQNNAESGQIGRPGDSKGAEPKEYEDVDADDTQPIVNDEMDARVPVNAGRDAQASTEVSASGSSDSKVFSFAASKAAGLHGIFSPVEKICDLASQASGKNRNAAPDEGAVVFLPCENIGQQQRDVAREALRQNLRPMVLSLLSGTDDNLYNYAGENEDNRIINVSYCGSEVRTEILVDKKHATPVIYFHPCEKQCDESSENTAVLFSGDESSSTERKAFISAAALSLIKEIVLQGNPEVRETLKRIGISSETPMIVHADMETEILLKTFTRIETEDNEHGGSLPAAGDEYPEFSSSLLNKLGKTVYSLVLDESNADWRNSLNNFFSEKGIDALKLWFEENNHEEAGFGLLRLGFSLADIVTIGAPGDENQIPEELKALVDIQDIGNKPGMLGRLVALWKTRLAEKNEVLSDSSEEVSQYALRGYNLGQAYGSEGILYLPERLITAEAAIAAPGMSSAYSEAEYEKIFGKMYGLVGKRSEKADATEFLRLNSTSLFKLSLQLLSGASGEEKAKDKAFDYCRKLLRAYLCSTKPGAKVNAAAELIGFMSGIYKGNGSRPFSIMKTPGTDIDIGKISALAAAA